MFDILFVTSAVSLVSLAMYLNRVELEDEY